MKIFQTILGVASLFLISSTQAQTEMPKGFTKGSITLSDNNTVSGYVKDNMRKHAEITFINDSQKKINYTGSDILSVLIGTENYICIKGDFFKTICNGKLCFLQKMSDASDKPTYNGIEAIYSNGTDGKPGDYFIYETNSKNLKLVTKKNLIDVSASSFAGCNEAIEKSKTITDDVLQLKEAVDVYNTKSEK